MPVTMSRLNLIDGLGPVLQIAEGYTVELPENAHEILDKRTDPTWPTTWFAPRLTGKGAFTDVYSVMANWGANHGAFSYGHIGADLITLASMLRIPVCMHNVPEKEIYRPSMWECIWHQRSRRSGLPCLRIAWPDLRAQIRRTIPCEFLHKATSPPRSSAA